MKKSFISKLMIILIFCIIQINTTAEEVSTVAEAEFGTGYASAYLPCVRDSLYSVALSGTIFPDNALQEDKITSSIIDTDIVFPFGTGSYVSVLVYSDNNVYKEIFRITPSGVTVKKNGCIALGIDEISQDTALYDEKDILNDTFKCMYDRKNKLRITFSSTNNKVGIQLNKHRAAYTIADADDDGYTFASEGAYKFCFYVGHLSELGKNLGVYLKNTEAYTVYRNSSSQKDRDAVSDRIGIYKYLYNDDSGDFLYTKEINSSYNKGYAVITGLDPNKCTKEIEEPVEKRYKIPDYADGYPVTEIKESALMGLELKRLIIENDIILKQNSLKGTADELVILGDVTIKSNPFDGYVPGTVYCSDMVYAKLQPYLSNKTEHKIPQILTAYYSDDGMLKEAFIGEMTDTIVKSVDFTPNDKYIKSVFVWDMEDKMEPLIDIIRINKRVKAEITARN